MSDQIAIHAESIGKQYALSSRQSYHRFSELITSYARRASRVATAWSSASTRRSNARSEKRQFWALQDIDFEIRQGDVVGIIGRNGAGKSTLLKVLSRITTPTTGRFGIRGRVGSLLEVGTGFHPELTGRENIFLSGSVLGMSRAEIRRKLDEIIDFAGVEQFVDTPVKRYSSGMQVRLGFAVAAHLEPEILIVDEVLAVGDAEFQKKCLGKMEGVAGSGRTILFVSHNMGAVGTLCTTAMELRSGKLVSHGDCASVIAQYNKSFDDESPHSLADARRAGSGSVRVEAITIFDDHGREVRSVPMGSTFSIEIVVLGEIKNASVSIILGDHRCQQILRGHTRENLRESVSLSGKTVMRCTFTNCPLMHGVYTIRTWIGQARNVAEYIDEAGRLEITPRDVHDSGMVPDPKCGYAFTDIDWSIHSV
ncbi:MAG: ABC transporter ATP-binding protein [Planctomycetota bacterium]